MMTIFNNNQQNQVLTPLCQSALLYLYFEISESSEIIPAIKRNEILTNFLKRKLKDDNYKYLKRELKSIKTMLSDKSSNGETYLINLLDTLEKDKQTIIIN